MPLATGISLPTSSSIFKAFSVVLLTDMLPPTVVIASNLTFSSDLRAKRIASASSIPGSPS